MRELEEGRRLDGCKFRSEVRGGSDTGRGVGSVHASGTIRYGRWKITYFGHTADLDARTVYVRRSTLTEENVALEPAWDEKNNSSA